MPNNAAISLTVSGPPGIHLLHKAAPEATGLSISGTSLGIRIEHIERREVFFQF